uniref:Uncharacterized protein n=1 Tax=Arundo donax TaxID=35708 RepID=A0A0A9CSY7_ARUDO
MHAFRHKKLVGKQRAARGGTSQGSIADGVNSERSIADGANLGKSSAGVGNSGRSSAGSANSHMSTAVANSSGFGNKRANEDPPKRGRGKMSRTQLRVPPRGRRVVLVPKGDSQFTYVVYNPKGLKYPSQVGAILKRAYPGIVIVYDDDGNEVVRRPAFSWNDYYWKNNGRGVACAKQVKEEFWSLFTVKPDAQEKRRAEHNLENYLVKRVTNMMYQARLDGIKKYYFDRKEDCDDERARTKEFTEEQYLACRLEWCDPEAWALLARYWTSDEYKEKRKRAQESRMNSEDPAQNRGVHGIFLRHNNSWIFLMALRRLAL